MGTGPIVCLRILIANYIYFFCPYLCDFRQNLTYLIRNVQNPDDKFTGTPVFYQNTDDKFTEIQNPDDEFTGTHLFYQYFEANRK